MAADQRITELTEQLENGVKEIFSSGRYREYLQAMSKFHYYSAGNVMLILLQCPTATCVAGFHRWKKEFGRYVKKGAKGIQILAPCLGKCFRQKEERDPATGEVVCNPDGTPKTVLQVETIRRYKVATVFDVSQTEGRELPGLGVEELHGEVENFPLIFERMCSISPLPVMLESISDSAKGYTSFSEKRIVVRSGMSEVQTLKTLIHEIAHAKLHDPATTGEEQRKNRSEREVEAESIAFVVCQYMGIDTSDYSFGYVAGWSADKELDELKASLELIRSTAKEVIAAIEEPEHSRELNKSLDHTKSEEVR
ncbi:MAG: ImmA/IrrE family metallo-endopeptidase [Oscillospiraceae bacterium]|nr:ImmA/IrrE family metallo-endopeptidase [Oscillospiraceae bacterium]